MPIGLDSRKAVSVARQPILDHAGHIFGYELLYRAAEGDSTWSFTPSLPWLAGDYSLRVGGALEDLAGNNVVRVFDVDRRVDNSGVDRDVAGATRAVRVRVR